MLNLSLSPVPMISSLISGLPMRWICVNTVDSAGLPPGVAGWALMRGREVVA